MPEMVGGKYRLLHRLGEGAMGTVYAAEHLGTGEHLALKLISGRQGENSQGLERFKREARAAAKIRSEHVVRVIDADIDEQLGGTPYIVMDLLEGKDLEQFAGDVPQPSNLVVLWLWQVAKALDKAHSIGIVHRDLKPENLFLTCREDGSLLLKVLDFGIAKLSLESGAISGGTTQMGQVLGTPLYMPPEQARGDANLTPAADRYALGLIAYRLLTGKPYWTGLTITSIIGQILYEPLVAPSERGADFGIAFDEWFLRACHKDPKQRFETSRLAVEQLAEALGVTLPDASSPDAQRGLGGGLERYEAGISPTPRGLGPWRAAAAGTLGADPTVPEGDTEPAPGASPSPVATARSGNTLQSGDAPNAGVVRPSETENSAGVPTVASVDIVLGSARRRRRVAMAITLALALILSFASALWFLPRIARGPRPPTAARGSALASSWPQLVEPPIRPATPGDTPLGEVRSLEPRAPSPQGSGPTNETRKPASHAAGAQPAPSGRVSGRPSNPTAQPNKGAPSSVEKVRLDDPLSDQK